MHDLLNVFSFSKYVDIYLPRTILPAYKKNSTNVEKVGSGAGKFILDSTAVRKVPELSKRH
jgi:hypothetical protein